MTDKLHCPFCGEELAKQIGSGGYACLNTEKCKFSFLVLPKQLWQALIDGKKAQRQLQTIKDSCVKKVKAKEREIASYLNGITVRQSENERLAKQLKQAQDALKEATNCISWTIDTICKGLDREADIVGCCELTLERIDKITSISKGTCK